MSSTILNLYLVILQNSSYQFYVVAGNAEEAYQKVRRNVESENYGYAKDRVLDSITLLAETRDWIDSDCNVKNLYL
jgi:hypothetical protein